MKLSPSFFAKTLRVFLLCLLLVAPVVEGCAVSLGGSSNRSEVWLSLLHLMMSGAGLLGFLIICVSLLYKLRRNGRHKKSRSTAGLLVGVFLIMVGASCLPVAPVQFISDASQYSCQQGVKK